MSHRVFSAPILPSIHQPPLQWMWSEEVIVVAVSLPATATLFPPRMWEDKWDPRLRSYGGLKSDCKSSLILLKSKQEDGVFADWVKTDLKWKVLAGLARHPLWGMSTSKKGEEVGNLMELMVKSQEECNCDSPGGELGIRTLKVLPIGDFPNCPIDRFSVTPRPLLSWSGLMKQWYVAKLHMCPQLNLSLPRVDNISVCTKTPSKIRPSTSR